MKYFFYFIGIFFLALYGALNYYIGYRGWQGVSRLMPFLNVKAYWIIVWILAFVYFLSRLSTRYFPEAVGNTVTFVGALWLPVMLYALIVVIIIDIIRLLDKLLHFIPKSFYQAQWSLPVVTLAAVMLIVGTVVYGYWNALNPRIRHYEVTVDKYAGSFENMHVVMVSDIHLGTIVNKKRLDGMVNRVNSLNPDLVLFAGDIIDEDIGPFIRQDMANSFLELKPKLGVYAVTGNHEYIGGHAEEIINHLGNVGVTMLTDKYVKVADGLYIVGRNDRAGQRSTGKPRLDMDTLMKGIDKSLPIILMDHQPSNLEEGEKAGVDLQLSGHTHKGQIFPFGYITHRIFEDDWGYLRKDSYQIIVSCGYGTWGPPVRTGNTPEIVDISLHFKKH